MNENIFDRLRVYCPLGFVTRKEIGKITGGFLPPNTQAQLDFKGIGIKNRQHIGKRVVYDIEEVIKWLKTNTILINFDD